MIVDVSDGLVAVEIDAVTAVIATQRIIRVHDGTIFAGVVGEVKLVNTAASFLVREMLLGTLVVAQVVRVAAVGGSDAGIVKAKMPLALL